MTRRGGYDKAESGERRNRRRYPRAAIDRVADRVIARRGRRAVIARLGHDLAEEVQLEGRFVGHGRGRVADGEGVADRVEGQDGRDVTIVGTVGDLDRA